MFAARGIAICLSVFALLYFALSLAVHWQWRRIWVYSRRFPARRCANLLFTWRMFPLGAAAAITLAFAAPSFLLLEPRSIDEPMGVIPLGFGLCGVTIVLVGLGNAARAMVRASRTIARWQNGARVECSGSIPVWRIPRALPTLVAAGIVRPKVLLSHRAELVLTPDELKTAVRHELAHVRRLDNLKKLFLCLAVFPGMAELEASWREASEMAADDGAVSSASEALDLAAVLIKLSRSGPLEAPAELTTALAQSPAASVTARVERLIAWAERRPSPAQGYSLGYVLLGAASVATIALMYSDLLVRVHAATEWMVR